MSQSGSDLIRIERQRQISVEQYDEKHDKDHAAELVSAARVYAEHGRFLVWHPGVGELLPDEPINIPVEWPWDRSFYKPTGNPVRDLVKAGALIAAAIDTLLAESEPNL